MSDTTVLAFAEFVPGSYRERLTQVIGPQVRVAIDCAGCERLPVGFLAVVLELTAAQHGFVALDGLGDAARLAVEVADEGEVLARSGARLAGLRANERAFAVTLDERGGVRIRALKGICQHRQLGENAGHEWLRGLAAEAVTIDLAEVEHVNSLLVAWLLQLCQAAAPAKVTLANLSRQASTQLMQLRLNHLMVMT